MDLSFIKWKPGIFLACNPDPTKKNSCLVLSLLIFIFLNSNVSIHCSVFSINFNLKKNLHNYRTSSFLAENVKHENIASTFRNKIVSCLDYLQQLRWNSVVSPQRGLWLLALAQHTPSKDWPSCLVPPSLFPFRFLPFALGIQALLFLSSSKDPDVSRRFVLD